MAHEKYSNIRYAAKCECLDDCFTEFNGNLIFWFTTDDNSTHIVKEEYVLLKEVTT